MGEQLSAEEIARERAIRAASIAARLSPTMRQRMLTASAENGFRVVSPSGWFGDSTSIALSSRGLLRGDALSETGILVLAILRAKATSGTSS